jgi:hypothetical protein
LPNERNHHHGYADGAPPPLCVHAGVKGRPGEPPRPSISWDTSQPESTLAPTTRSTHIHPMTTLVTILLVLALVGVLAVLVFGVVTMLRGGNPRRSNKLMQMRVIMQGLALLLLAILMLLAKH